MIRDKRGMTLIEILIAFTLLAIVSVTLVKSSLLVMSTNVQNELRDEAVRVAEQRMNELRNTLFTAPTGSTNYLTPTMEPSPGKLDSSVTMKFRMFDFTYDIYRMVTDVGAPPTAKQVTVTVQWKYKNNNYNHTVSTVLRQP